MTNDKITENIRSFLINELGISQDTKNSDCLFSRGILDSLDILSILSHFEKSLGVSFSPFEIGLEQLDTIELMVRAINSKK